MVTLTPPYQVQTASSSLRLLISCLQRHTDALQVSPSMSDPVSATGPVTSSALCRLDSSPLMTWSVYSLDICYCSELLFWCLQHSVLLITLLLPMFFWFEDCISFHIPSPNKSIILTANYKMRIVVVLAKTLVRNNLPKNVSDIEYRCSLSQPVNDAISNWQGFKKPFRWHFDRVQYHDSSIPDPRG